MYAVVTCLLIILLNLPFSVQLDYICYPNGALEVTYPSYDLDAVKVKDDFDLCEVTFNQDMTLKIDNCKMDHFVHVVFFKSTHPKIITGVSKGYKIMCKSLPPQGIEISVRAGMMTKNHIEELEQEPQTTQLTRIFSHVEDENSEQYQKLHLDDKFEWVFEIADDYHTLPESCTAYAGRVVSPTADSKNLMMNGCTQDDDVISDFQRLEKEDGAKNRYMLQFNVFRFKSDPFITVICSMRVCPDKSRDNCNATCNNDMRRRRRRSSRDTGKVNNMVVVLEVLDERPADTGVSSQRIEDIWRAMMEDLRSSGDGNDSLVCMATVLMSLVICLFW